MHQVRRLLARCQASCPAGRPRPTGAPQRPRRFVLRARRCTRHYVCIPRVKGGLHTASQPMASGQGWLPGGPAQVGSGARGHGTCMGAIGIADLARRRLHTGTSDYICLHSAEVGVPEETRETPPFTMSQLPQHSLTCRSPCDDSYLPTHQNEKREVQLLRLVLHALWHGFLFTAACKSSRFHCFATEIGR